MKFKNSNTKIILLTLLTITPIFSCTPSISDYEATYTVIWQNFNGDILEIDRNQKEGTIPSYLGDTPIREDDENYTYTFYKWTPNIEKIYENTTYTATYKKERKFIENLNGYEPKLNKEENTIEYGLYPTSYVNDVNIINELEKIEKPIRNDWYLLNDTYYKKEKANVFNNETYKFNNGETIVNETEYWFKCETIKWKILSNNNGNYYVLSTLLLDTGVYYSDYSERVIDGNIIYPNNYEHSSIRKWLNNDFFNIAFSLNNTYIKTTSVINSASSFSNESTSIYESNDTNDLIYLPSFNDYFNTSFGFESNINSTSSTRTCLTTDYARCKGAWLNNKNTNLKNNGTYFTRSPSPNFNYAVYSVNSGGYMSEYVVDNNSSCIRPALTLRL